MWLLIIMKDAVMGVELFRDIRSMPTHEESEKTSYLRTLLFIELLVAGLFVRTAKNWVQDIDPTRLSNQLLKANMEASKVYMFPDNTWNVAQGAWLQIERVMADLLSMYRALVSDKRKQQHRPIFYDNIYLFGKNVVAAFRIGREIVVMSSLEREDFNIFSTLRSYGATSPDMWQSLESGRSVRRGFDG
ncbi:hypothetical protein IAR50_005611 [Cryptococcus sp. DSM 104548]